MAKLGMTYACRECGATYSKWLGKCEACGAWDTLEAEVSAPTLSPATRQALKVGKTRGTELTFVSLTGQAAPLERFSTGIGELDTVLGGGLVPGSAILIGGDPGIGKS